MRWMASIAEGDIVIEGGCLREECASLYYPPDADLPRQEQANL